jgi:hypothetical protein
VVVLLIIASKSCDKSSRLEKSYKAVNDSLYYSRNENGELVTSTRVLVLTKWELENTIKSKDSGIIELQKINKRIGKDLATATYLLMTTRETGWSATDHVLEKDTIRINGEVHHYPEYVDTIRKPNLLAVLRMNKDSAYYNIEMYNKMNVVTRYHRKRLLAKRDSPFDKNELVVDVTTYNPNSGIEELKSFTPAEPKKHRAVTILGAVLIGLGIGIVAF